MTIKSLVGERTVHLHFIPREMQSDLLTWYYKNRQLYPWRILWNSLKDPYPVWISEVMLQQTTLAAVLPIYERFLKRFPTVASLADAAEDEVKTEVKGLGYYRRFSLLHKGARKIWSESDSEKIAWPVNYTDWLLVPGVGEYTAAALSSITLGEPIPVLDGNVIRVLCRQFDLRQVSNDVSLLKKLKELAKELVSHEYPGDYNQALMELGQSLCRPQSPTCLFCPVQKTCLAYDRKSTHLAPQAKIRRAQENIKMRLYVLTNNEQIGLFIRPKTAKFLRGTGGFLTELMNAESFVIDGHQDIRLDPGCSLGFFTHQITHHRIQVEVQSLNGAKLPKKSFLREGLQWFSPKEVHSKLISSLDMKAWKLFEKEQQKGV